MKTFKQFIKSHMCDLSSLNESLLDDEDELASPVNEVREFLDKIYKCSKEFEIDDSKDPIRVSTKGRVEISAKVKNLSELTNGLFEFYETGDFIAWVDLTTLKGSPRHVHGTFNVCSSKLESLEGGPEVVDNGYVCAECDSLESLEGAPVKVPGTFNCSDCWSLKTLKGAPKFVGKDFICEGCIGLKNFRYLPNKVGGSIMK